MFVINVMYQLLLFYDHVTHMYCLYFLPLAIRRADIGIAMMSGAEVAREASDMILLDNDFVSVVAAIETGRLVSENLKKTCLYLLPAGSFGELLPILANFFLGLPLPLSAFLMICICMLTDLGPSLALVNESPEGPIMLRKPATNPKLVDWKLFVQAYLFIGMFESLCAFLCFFLYFNENNLPPSALFFAFDKYKKMGIWVRLKLNLMN